MSLRSWMFVFAFAFIFCISLLVMAPASLLGAQLEGFSGGRLSMANTRGTLWHGSGILLFQHETRFITLGDYAWQLSPSALFTHGLAFEVRHGEQGSAMQLAFAPMQQKLELTHWHTTLPAQILAVLAPQLRPYQLSGEIGLTTDSFAFSPSGAQGKANLDWMQAGSGLSHVYPLGSYQIMLEGAGNKTTVQLVTVSGELQLAGSGQIELDKGLDFKGTAQAASGEQQEALTELLHHVGPETSPGVFALGLIAH